MKLSTDAYFCEDLLVYTGSPTYVAQGFQLELPAIEHASIAALNRLEDELRVVLRALRDRTELQIQWTVGSHYETELMRYYERTDGNSMPEAARSCRNHHFTRSWQQMEAGNLRREELRFFVNMPLGNDPTPVTIQSCAAGFSTYEDLFEQFARSLGGHVRRFSDDDHFRACFRFFNPSKTADDHPFDPLASMQENCLLGDAAPITNPAGFYLGGVYHGILAIKSPPQVSFSGMMRGLTGLPMRDYAITVNVRALDVAQEIRKEETQIEKLERAMRHNPKERMRSAIETRTNRIRRLMADEVVPMQAQLMIRCWDAELSRLQSKLSVLESSIVKLQGASYHRPSFPPSARNYMIGCIPGETRRDYGEGNLLIEDHNLANLLPISSSSTGMLEQAEAIYPGANGNLVGIRSFAGEDSSPQHALITGMTGAGKSVLLSDLLLQTEPYYDFTVIVDDGLSHERYIRQVSDQPPIVIRAEGNITFNYLDTNRLPLSPQQFGDAAAMVAIMTRVREKDLPLQGAIVTEALQSLYRQNFDELVADTPELLALASACCEEIKTVQEENEDHTFTEAFLELRSRHPDLTDYLRGKGSEADSSNDEVMRLAYAFMTPEQMPTHSDLVDWFERESHGESRNAVEFGKLATQLARWKSGGSYGKLVDGVTNVSLTGSHVHIELSKISNSMPELRSIAAFLVTNYVRSEIMNRPRESRKRVIFEELGGFSNVPGGEAIVSEFYTRMRKYHCWILSVIQLGKMMQDSSVTTSLLGNARIGIFFARPTKASWITWLTVSICRNPRVKRFYALLSQPRSTVRRFSTITKPPNPSSPPQDT